jgi:DNA gyrase/topoisomerase IV subunit A
LKRERDELETKVMKLDMEVRNIQSIEERKYQVEIMRLKYEVEELKRELQMDAAAADIAAPALTSALARVRARRGTATGAAAPCKPEDAACMPQVATAASDIAAPLLTSALARVRARRRTATGAAAPGKPEDAACMPQVATAASTAGAWSRETCAICTRALCAAAVLGCCLLLWALTP